MIDQKRLILLYQKLADHTLPECKHTCQVPLSCCSPEYCDMAIRCAKEDWHIDLPTTDHVRLPLMGENGCTAPPYLRPWCTLHTCQVNSFGFKPGDEAWTKKYFDLRDEIEELEYERDLKEKSCQT